MERTDVTGMAAAEVAAWDARHATDIEQAIWKHVQMIYFALSLTNFLIFQDITGWGWWFGSGLG